MLAHLVINLYILCTEAQTQALNSHRNIRYDTTDLRYIGGNKFTGNVDALGNLKHLQHLCVAFSCCIVHICLRDIKTIHPKETNLFMYLVALHARINILLYNIYYLVQE